jgi:predicted tellurium resistance membrane protein TerC
VVSIPIIVWGSQLVLKLMDKYPIIITAGGMLLGWIAGAMAITDPAVLPFVPTQQGLGSLPVVDATWRYAAGALGAALVWVVGAAIRRRAAA